MSKMFTIVVAAGSSTRFGSDKLCEIINGETVLERTVRIALLVSDGVVVVCDPAKFQNEHVHAIVAGGITRSESVRNGLAQVPNDVDIIAVQDGARPMASVDLYRRGQSLIENGARGAIPVVKVIDTIKEVSNNSIKQTVDREKLRAAQTPQIFNAKTLREVYQSDTADTDDAALLENAGYEVLTFDGHVENRKVTTKNDIEIILATLNKSQTTFRIGTGYDIHPFSKDKNRKLILGGVQIDHVGLEGHSDSDALAHALTDSLLSAIGAPDLGTLFPASKQENKDTNSFVFLEAAVKLVSDKGFEIGNATIIVNAQDPKLAPHLESMKQNILIALKPISNENTLLSITPKHGEGIGEIGRAEAIAVYSTVLLTSL